jgi:RNA polymerase sigma-70 factor (ECF subfamily)
MQASDGSDVELVQAVVGGDQAALAEIYDRHARGVYAVAVRLLGDPSSAEEVVQETMLALWNRAELFDAAAGTLEGWLTVIARNRAIDRLRRAGRRISAIPFGAVTARGDEDEARAIDRVLERGQVLAAGRREADPAAAAETAWLRETLAQNVAALPADERRVIELAYSGDLSQSEIARLLDWPLGTVKTRTRRALLALRQSLAEALDGGRQPALRHAEVVARERPCDDDVIGHVLSKAAPC